MKKIILLTVIAFLSIHLCYAQATPDAEERSVQKAVTAMFQALADRDTSLLKQHCTRDIMILETGLVWSIDSLVQRISKPVSEDFKRVNTFDFIKTDIKENIAWMTFYNRADITSNGLQTFREWLETGIFIKENGQWKMKLLHSTLLKMRVRQREFANTLLTPLWRL